MFDLESPRFFSHSGKLPSALSWVVTQRAEALSAGVFTAVGSSLQMIWFIHLVWTVSYLALCSVPLCRLTLGPISY
jgi:hypothetical protein